MAKKGEMKLQRWDGKIERWLRTSSFCPFCGEARVATLIGGRQTETTTGHALGLNQCPACSAVFLLGAPQPDPDDARRAAQIAKIDQIAVSGGSGAVSHSTRPPKR